VNDTIVDHSDAVANLRPPWYHRHGVRRLMYVAGVLVGLAALWFVRYPLYVTEECVVLPLRRVEVRAQIDGLISAIYVDEGAQVAAGQVIARFEDRDLNSTLFQAKADYDRLDANLLKLQRGSRKEEIARAEAVVAARVQDLRYAKIELDRREKLLAQDVGNAEQRDTARRDFELKKNMLEQARAELGLVRAGNRPEEVAVAEAELRRARTQVEFLEKRLSLAAINSPIDGTLVTPHFHERLHEKVAAGGAICEIADTRHVRVEILVPERYIDKVALGQPTKVKVQSYPFHPFTGVVTFIASAVEERHEQRFLRVVTEIENSEGLLREQMSGYAEINTGKNRVLVLMFRRMFRWVRVRFLI
jgi:multidrug resistance efflux pump